MTFLVGHLFFISYNSSNFVHVSFNLKQNVCTEFFQEGKFSYSVTLSFNLIKLNVECIQTNLDMNANFLVEKKKIKIMNDIFH